jgi:hypothetical protein
MFSQATRLELTIVVAALLVLFLCRQPPKSGNAGIRTEIGRIPEAGQRMDNGKRTAENVAASHPQSEIGNSQSSGPQLRVITPSSDAATPDNNSTESAMPPQPKIKRIGMVDARKCSGLNYKDVMYGEITVRWVWDGQKNVPEKVCQVREPSGVISTWSFDNHDGIVLSEIP